MTTDASLQSALNKHCNAMTPTMPIVWENMAYTPVIGTAHLRTWLLPGETFPITLGPGCLMEYSGFFQVDCYYPKNKGWGPAKTKAGSVCSHFKPGTRITYNTIQVLIWRASPGPALIDGEWYKVPVSIAYSVYDFNT